jgi:CDP-paratose 2-epimerase
MKTPRSRKYGPVVVTGGAGFIGVNLADRLLTDGEEVLIFDNLSRPGVDQNLRWLHSRHRGRVRLSRHDVRDRSAVSDAIKQASSVFHFAAQVAVTTSLDDPSLDFEVNALGTLNVLEALRKTNASAPLVFTSTNKVYGCMERLPLHSQESRYIPTSNQIRDRGFNESEPLTFASPYGCSKGAADQYVLDYASSYDLQTVVVRMSCIYGPCQVGNEDQGWVAHFSRQAIAGLPITIYGDGRQVRDLLFVGDLLEVLLLAREHSHLVAGEAFNIGGGPGNTASIREVLSMIAELEESDLKLDFGEWRTGDQKYYVSDCSKFHSATGWMPTTSVQEGIRTLHSWLRNHAGSKLQTLAA